MDKKTLLGIGLLAGFLIIWQSVIVPSLPEEWMFEKRTTPPQSTEEHKTNQESATITPPAAETNKINSPNLGQASPLSQKQPPKLPEKFYTVETDVLRAVFSSKGAALTQLELKSFHPHVGDETPLAILKRPSLVPNASRDDFQALLSKNGEQQTLSLWNENFKIVYRFTANSYFIDLDLQQLSGEGFSLNLEELEKDPSHRGGMSRGNEGAITSLKQREYGDNSSALLAEQLEGHLHFDSPAGDLRWSGFRNAYFALFIEPKQDNLRRHNIDFQNLNDGKMAMTLGIIGGQTSKYRLYAGPLDKNGLYKLDRERYGELYNYTGINVVIHFLLWLLNFYNSIPAINMGIAILMLTLTVRIAMFPLNLKAQSSMFMMSKVGPKIKALQEKFKNDRQQLGVEQMKLFKDEGINPMAGCLPMLIQMPVMISLFSTVGEGFSLRHASFASWITDLSSPDALFLMPFDLPFLGNGDGTMNFNLLVLLYIVTMLIQQSMMPKSSDPQQQQTQKMMKFMMVGFAVILYNYSSGLMLYFVGSNCLGMAESWYIRNKVLPAMEKKRSAKA